MKKVLGLLLASLFVLGGCTSEQKLKEQMTKVLQEHPELLIAAMEKKPVEFVEAFQVAIKKAQEQMASKKDEDEKKELEGYFEKPLVANLEGAFVRGVKGAPITLVEYSDFECPYCTRGYQTVMELMKKYEGKIQFVYKHLPLSFHQNAMITSQYYEAIAMQSPEKAFKFHDEVFKNQGKLKLGESFLKTVAKQVGADVKKVEKDIKSETVLKRIEADQKEAAQFGMQGTPGFLINGVPVRGAYPAAYFEEVVEKLKAKGKLKI